MTTDFRRTHPDSLFLTDNGKCLCGQHLGMSARFTGHDISGQAILRLTTAVLAMLTEEGDDYTPACEHCGLTPEATR